MRTLAWLAAPVLLLAAAPAAPAQTPAPPPGAATPRAAGQGELRGTIVDESGAPVATASVALVSRADSALVSGAVVGRDGRFTLRGLAPGAYHLRVSAVGFEPAASEELVVGAGAARVAAGTIRLRRSAVVIEGLTVQGERHAVSLAPDRNSYSTKDLAQAGGTATDVLRAVPSVQVDGDGKVSLRGNENVVVQINGRPSPLRGDQLAGYLQQLPSNLVDRVEVVPNPSAKYDPEGMAGIINVVLKQNADLGLSGGVMAGYGTGGRYNGSGNLGYQVGPLTLFGSYGFNDERRKSAGINNRTYHLPGAELSFRGQDVAGRMDQGGHNLNASADYRLGERDVVSTGLLVNVRGFSDVTTNTYRELAQGGGLVGNYDRLADGGSDDLLVDANAAWKRTWEPQRNELTTEIRLNRSESDNHNEFSRRALGGGAIAGGLTDRERSATDSRNYELTAQADYVRAFGEGTKLETGFKGTARWLDNDYGAFDIPDGGSSWVPNLGRSNTFEYDEQVNAVYGVLTHAIGKFSLQGGLRAEQATTDFLLRTTRERYDNQYASLFPSGVVSYNLSDKQQVKASYSRRIRRPDSRQLNPFPFFMDPQNAQIGSPELRPEYTDAFELGIQHAGQMGTLQLSPFYRRTTDVIRFIVEVGDTLGGREITSINLRNLATSTSWGSDLNGSLKLGKRLNTMASFNLYKMVTDGGDVQSALSSDAVIWSTRVNGTLTLSPTVDIQGMYSYRAPMKFENGRFSSFRMSTFSVRKKLNGDRSSLSLRVMDPFNTMGFRVEVGDGRITQQTHRTFGARAVYLNFQHSVGRPPRLRQRPQPQGEQAQPGGFGSS